MYFTIQRENIRPSKKETNKAATKSKLPDERFLGRKQCTLLSSVKTFAPQRKKLTRLLQNPNFPMFAVRL
jgi:hypothetical protein